MPMLGLGRSNFQQAFTRTIKARPCKRDAPLQSANPPKFLRHKAKPHSGKGKEERRLLPKGLRMRVLFLCVAKRSLTRPHGFVNGVFNPWRMTAYRANLPMQLQMLGR